MLVLQLVPVVLSLAVLAAHFARYGQWILVFLSIALMGLLAVPRRWAARLLQAGQQGFQRVVLQLAGLRAGRMLQRLDAVQHQQRAVLRDQFGQPRSFVPGQRLAVGHGRVAEEFQSGGDEHRGVGRSLGAGLVALAAGTLVVEGPIKIPLDAAVRIAIQHSIFPA